MSVYWSVSVISVDKVKGSARTWMWQSLRYAPQSIDASPEVFPGMIVLCLLKWVASPQASSISKLIEFKPMGLRISCDEWANPFRIHWPGKPTSKVRICANQLHESSNGLCGRVAEQWTPGPTRAY